MKMIAGITGGIGSGKSSVTDQLEKLKIDVVDADIISRSIVRPGEEALEKIAAHFGQEIILPNGNLDRSKLRFIVFSETEEKKWLENLTHPLIANEITTQIESANSPYVILSSALLLESGQKDLVDLIIVVDAPESLQLSRTILRDENSSDLVKKIMKSQLSREERLSQADIIIDNSHSLETLEINTRNIHKDLMRQAKNNQYN